MSFKREKIQNYYLHDTPVENVFINEYLIDAPGDYVKVYLFALMYAELRMTMNNDSIAKQLAMEGEDVLKAWSYWEAKGVIRRHFSDPEDRFHYNVEFVNLKEQIYGKNGKTKKGEDDMIPAALAGLMSDQELRKLYSRIEQITGRVFEGKEPAAILEWLGDYGIDKELVVYAYEYCETKRKNTKYNYVAAVIKEWAGKGFKTVAQIEEHLAENDNRHYLYKRIMKSLGFLRNATEEEKRIMDTWFDELDLQLEEVLSACKKTSGISNPNINYVNTVLKAWRSGEKGDRREVSGNGSSSGSHPISEVLRSFDEERNKNELEAEERREAVYRTVPRIQEIEEELRRLSLSISREMLSGNKSGIEEKKKAVENLNNEKAYLLTDNNFRTDHMEIRYTCRMCNDTGTLESGERCSCFLNKLEQYGKKV